MRADALAAPVDLVAYGRWFVPRPALHLVIDLELRGVPLGLDAAQQLTLETTAASGALTFGDRTAIALWRADLAVIVRETREIGNRYPLVRT